MTFEEGDPVDVYDEDLRDWVPGIVDSIGTDEVLGAIVVVRTQQMFEGLPLKYVVTANATPTLLRRSR